MVHIQSKIGVGCFREPVSELASYWFGYLKGKAYRFKKRNRIRIRTPLSDIGHLFQLGKDIGMLRIPRKIEGKYGRYAQLIIDSKDLCGTLNECGWNGVPSPDLDPRHVIRGLLDGCGSISRNGRGKQAKYLRVAFYSKDEDLLFWIFGHLGNRKVCNDHISWVGSRAVEILKYLYLNQSRYLSRKFDKAAAAILR